MLFRLQEDVHRMTRQHIGVALALNIPVFVVVTKTDLCSPERVDETVRQVSLATVYRAFLSYLSPLVPRVRAHPGGPVCTQPLAGARPP